MKSEQEFEMKQLMEKENKREYNKKRFMLDFEYVTSFMICLSLMMISMVAIGWNIVIMSSVWMETQNETHLMLIIGLFIAMIVVYSFALGYLEDYQKRSLKKLEELKNEYTKR